MAHKKAGRATSLARDKDQTSQSCRNKVHTSCRKASRKSRDREYKVHLPTREACTAHTHTHTHTYIYMEVRQFNKKRERGRVRERERERERESKKRRSECSATYYYRIFSLGGG